jgi:hypothetical protein
MTVSTIKERNKDKRKRKRRSSDRHGFASEV